MNQALNTFEFHEEHGIEYLYIEQQRVEKYKFKSIRVLSDYQLSLCTEETVSNSVEVINLDELILFSEGSSIVMMPFMICSLRGI